MQLTCSIGSKFCCVCGFSHEWSGSENAPGWASIAVASFDVSFEPDRIKHARLSPPHAGYITPAFLINQNGPQARRFICTFVSGGNVFAIFRRKRAKEGSQLSPEADAYLASATSEFNEKQAALSSQWGFGSYEQWNFDQYTGVLELKLADGSSVLADGQILGSHATRDGSWEWAWSNPNVEAGVARASHRVKKLGARLGISYLVQSRIPVEEDSFVSYLCAIGVKATDSNGVFVGSAGPINVHLLVSNLRRS